MIPHIKRISAKMKPPTTARAMGLIVTIKKGHEHDRALIIHELTHVKQWWRLVVLFALVCAVAWHFGYGEAAFPLMVCGVMAHNVLSRARFYRKYAEVEAFRAHVKAGRNLDEAALSLSRYYDLNISQAEARDLLK